MPAADLGLVLRVDQIWWGEVDRASKIRMRNMFAFAREGCKGGFTSVIEGRRVKPDLTIDHEATREVGCFGMAELRLASNLEHLRQLRHATCDSYQIDSRCTFWPPSAREFTSGPRARLQTNQRPPFPSSQLATLRYYRWLGHLH